jgi:hypothetical protein
VGSVDVAADGTFTADFVIDAGMVPAGDHTLQMQGVGEDGYVRAANLGVVVDDMVEQVAAPAGSFPVLPVVFIGSALVAIAVVVGVIVVRRGAAGRFGTRLSAGFSRLRFRARS